MSPGDYVEKEVVDPDTSNCKDDDTQQPEGLSVTLSVKKTKNKSSI